MSKIPKTIAYVMADILKVDWALPEARLVKLPALKGGASGFHRELFPPP